MSYLSNDTVTVDAILTKRGRELFSQGKFSITKFALSDDEIDYGLYDKTHPSGSDYYSVAIENLPMLEAIPDGSKMMKHKLVTLPKGTTTIPIVTVGLTSVTLLAKDTRYPGESQQITPSTVNGLNTTLGYTATIYSTTYVDLMVREQVSNPTAATSGATYQPGYSVVGLSFLLQAKELGNAKNATTTLVITGNETGGTVTIPVYISDGK